MANCFFIIMDTKKERNDEEQMMFFNCPFLNDISGYLARIAREREAPIEDFRLYVCPSKKVWVKMFNDFLRRVAGKE